MKSFRVYAASADSGGGERLLLTDVGRAESPLTLAVGLIGLRGEGQPSLWLPDTSLIHTVGMRFAIDVAFLDRDNVCLAFRAELKPLSFACGPRGTRSVLETKTVPISVFNGIALGQKLRFEMEHEVD